MPHPQFTGPRNALNEAGWKELARLVREQADTATIADALGLSRNWASRSALRVRRALSVDHPLKEQRQARVAQIGSMLAAGGTNESVASALGIDSKTVSAARRDLGLAQPAHLRLDETEYAEIDRRLIAGDRISVIARDMTVSHATIWKRHRAIKPMIPADFPPCRCGRPHNHSGACRLMPEKVQYVRDQLAAGRRMEWIAPELSISVRALRDYALPIIADLQAAGVKCACGREVSHKPPCPDTHRWPIDPAFQNQVRELLEMGMARLTIAKHLACSFHKVRRAATPILAQMAAEGVKCDCGDAINHRGTCAARAVAPAFKGHIYGKAARTIPLDKRYRAARLALSGVGIGTICARLSLKEYGVAALVGDLRAAGKLPDRCRCGARYNHRGACRAKASSKKQPVSKNRPWLAKPKINDPALERRMWEHWRKGASLEQISQWSGVSFTSLQRLGTFWMSRKTKPGPPCVCGRPFHHPGGCIRNTPGALSPVEAKRIERRTRAGDLPHKIAADMGLTTATVMRHTLALRDRLVAEGVSCSCGRRIAHLGWCAAKWDAWDMPRGARPLDKSHRRKIEAALLRGDVVADIASAANISADRVWAARREMSAAEQAARTNAVRARIRRTDASGEDITRAIEEALPKSFVRLLPSGLMVSEQLLDRSYAASRIRDSVISELFLAITDGRVEVEQLPDVVRSFIRRGIKGWTDLYSISADAQFGADDSRNLVGTLSDSTTMAGVDEMELGEPPP